MSNVSLVPPQTVRQPPAISTAARPRTSLPSDSVPKQPLSTLPTRKSSDPSSELRKACLGVLGTLKEMDTTYRLDPQVVSEEGDEEGDLYRAVNLNDLSKEKEDVCRWILIVDRTLFASIASAKIADAQESGSRSNRSPYPLPERPENGREAVIPHWAETESFASWPLCEPCTDGYQVLSTNELFQSANL